MFILGSKQAHTTWGTEGQSLCIWLMLMMRPLAPQAKGIDSIESSFGLSCCVESSKKRAASLLMIGPQGACAGDVGTYTGFRTASTNNHRPASLCAAPLRQYSMPPVISKHVCHHRGLSSIKGAVWYDTSTRQYLLRRTSLHACHHEGHDWTRRVLP